MGRCSMTSTTWFFYSETECVSALVVSLIIRRLVLFNIFWSPSVKFLVSSVNRSAASHSSCRSTERSWRSEAAAEVLLDFTQLNMQTQRKHQSTSRVWSSESARQLTQSSTMKTRRPVKKQQTRLQSSEDVGRLSFAGNTWRRQKVWESIWSL